MGKDLYELTKVFDKGRTIIFLLGGGVTIFGTCRQLFLKSSNEKKLFETYML